MSGANIPRLQVSVPAEGADNYTAALERAGGTPAAGYCPAPDLSCAGLVLCGGGDIACELFGQEDRGSNPPDLARDRAELALFQAFYGAGKPILGICRGMQIINVALGGTLIQDLPGPRGISTPGMERTRSTPSPAWRAPCSIACTAPSVR